jgi:hypothetical protein
MMGSDMLPVNNQIEENEYNGILEQCGCWIPIENTEVS